MVKVVFSSALRSVTNGESEFEIEFSGNISSLFDILKSNYGETFEHRIFENGSPKRYVNVYLDGKDIRFLNGLKTEVKESSEVLFLPAVSGG